MDEIWLITLKKDGNGWCAMVGPDPMEGEAAYMVEPMDALYELFHTYIIPSLI